MSNSTKKKFDPIQIIGVLVCVLILGYMMFRNRPVPQQPTPAPTAKTEATGNATPQATAPAPAAQAQQTPAAQKAAAQPGADQAAPATLRPVDEALPISKHIPVTLKRGDEALYAIDTQGAGITAVTLPKFRRDKARSGETGKNIPVTLGGADYPFLSFIAPGTWNFKKPVVSSKNDSATLERTSQDGNFTITECWNVSSAAKPNEIRYTLKIRNNSKGAQCLTNLRLSGGAMPTNVAPDRKGSRGESAGGLFLGRGKGEKIAEFSVQNLAKKLGKGDTAKKLSATATTWTAVHSKYFLLAMWGNKDPFPGVECAPVKSQRGDAKQDCCYVRALLPDLMLQPGQEITQEFTAYAGPKNYEQLYALDNGLDSVMQMDMFFFWRPGWMGQISRGLLRLLVWISSFFPPSIGWGLSIILLTLLLKILFWPLSHKSTVSMRKMAILKPELDKIRAQYKDNPQLMYMKQQELMKANGVSQLGGCLPMLLQIPVFFALFNTFRNAIELRHASFLWAYDLSMPDTLAFSPSALPIRPLAIMMAATMYFQQKLTPSADPQQSKMMTFMSIFFMFMFYGMPSALTLYLTVTYLLGFLQTWLVNKFLPPIQPGAVTVKK